MRYKEAVDNGNIAVGIRQARPRYTNINDSHWSDFNSTSLSNIKNRIYHSRKSNNAINPEGTLSVYPGDCIEGVCNEQYLRTQQNINLVSSYIDKETGNLDQNTDVTITRRREAFLEHTNVSPSNRYLAKKEVQIVSSDTDEMTETDSGCRVPRGIVNPNYPGFQHLAHTLQNYSSNIDNPYKSENDMTDDDDADIEISDISYDTELKRSVSQENYANINNNIIYYDTEEKKTNSDKDFCTLNCNYDKYTETEIPDLLKTVSKNYNNDKSIDLDFHDCTDADIENNFNTEDIIGNFNKEVEDEIKHLLNYNINIQDDLEELRKDIKETFAKPIENTINNISDVVNHVIKRLVKSQDTCKTVENELMCDNTHNIKKLYEIRERNTVKEMILSRPTFLLIEKNSDEMIVDAFLSDGKDEIIINENNYDSEILSNTIEKTIHQLSSELRKIIPKLDEMRQQDKVWEESCQESKRCKVDKNSNETTSSKNENNKIKNAHYQITEDKNMQSCNIVTDPKYRAYHMLKGDAEFSNFENAECLSSVLQNSRDCSLERFDVYNLETTLPKIDIDTIENHLRAAKEAERQKLNDREEIRRRLAMGVDCEEYYGMGFTDRPGKKPSLQSRLQNGKNLQICFMNETASDNESQNSDAERSLLHGKNMSSHFYNKNSFSNPYQTKPLSIGITKHDSISTIKNVSGGKLKPMSLLSKTKSRSSHSLGHIELKESDFYALQSTLQTEARIALAQAKEMARIQMERERGARPVSPVTEMLRRTMEKAHAPLAPDRRRVSRQILTDMNIAQLQVIVNSLHCEIEHLNETLVELLMRRDELHMGQDSMLVDIEDLTRYLGVREQSKKTKGSSRSGVRRLASLVHK